MRARLPTLIGRCAVIVIASVASHAANERPVADPQEAPAPRATPEPDRPQYIAHAGIAMNVPDDVPLQRRPEAIDRKAESSRVASATGAVVRAPESGAPPPSGAACQTIGPIDESARADEVKNALGDVVDQVVVRSESVPVPNGLIIVSPPQGGTAEARALAEKMQAAGLEDIYVFGRGPYKGRVSLGIYNKKAFAHARVAEIQAAGFPAEALTRTRDVIRYWVDVAGTAELAADLSLLPDGIRDELAEFGAIPAECESRYAAGN